LPDGSRISGIAEVTVSDALLGNYFIKRAAPYAKHPDVKGDSISTSRPWSP